MTDKVLTVVPSPDDMLAENDSNVSSPAAGQGDGAPKVDQLWRQIDFPNSTNPDRIQW
jgi:hypothetical protein